MWTWNVGDSVPPDEPARCTFRIIPGETIYVFDALGKQMDPPAISRRESLNLLDDAKLSSMATIQEGRNYNNLQVGLRLLIVFTRLFERQEDSLEIPKLGTESQASAKNRYSGQSLGKQRTHKSSLERPAER